MDVLPAEAQKLRQLMTAWSEHDDYELEATFGPKGNVDVTSFFAIAQRLKAKGYEALPQEDRLNIILPERIRVTLTGSGIIQQYCRDDSLSNKPFTAMIKDRTFVESNLDLDEYDLRIKVRREIEMATDDAKLREVLERWSVHRKAFRLIRRWSFVGHGVQFDLSIVRSTRRDARGEFKWVRSFKEQNFLQDIPVYEVEVELHRTTSPDITIATKNLIKGIGEVLRGFQKNSILIRNSIKNRVLNGYRQLTGTDQFRGVAPVTMEVHNMSSTIINDMPNIRTGYNVTDKADGLRVHAYVDKTGELFLIDMGMNVYRTGLQKESCASSLLDGEWVTRDRTGAGVSQLHIFDIYIAPGGEVIDQLPFRYIPAVGEARASEEVRSRFLEMKQWFAAWNEPRIIAAGVNDSNKLLVSLKEFKFARSGQGIFNAAALVLDTQMKYNTDGLIFTPNDAPLPQRPGESFKGQFKWKPSHDNTIDFLVNFEKDPESPLIDKVAVGINPNSNSTTRYKTMRLYVGTRSTPEELDPRQAILYEAQAFKDVVQNQKSGYSAIIFVPTDYADAKASICHREVQLDVATGDEFILTEGTKEPIRDRSIVEMMYDPQREPGWRWVPLRVRHDKTERLMRGILSRTLNNEMVANSVWNSIHNPVTEFMIRKGSDEPSEEEIRAFGETYKVADTMGKDFERKENKADLLLVRGMSDFHNNYIKDTILYRIALSGGSKTLLAAECGEGGADLRLWLKGGIKFALGTDMSANAIKNPQSGAYKRYVGFINRAKEAGTQVPPMVFSIADASRGLIDGSAGATSEERDMLRSIFGRVKPEGSLPSYIERVAANQMRDGTDVITCMFRINRFFESRELLDGFVNQINDNLKVGGYFIGCGFDGDVVFNMLRSFELGQSKMGIIGDTPIWSITKSYDVDDFGADYDSLGLAIDVNFISIGTVQREYLMNFDFLVERLRSIGIELLTDTESREVGLAAPSSTNMFDVSHAMADRAGRKFTMDPVVRQFSFLNRWFIFRRKGTSAGPLPGEGPIAASKASRKVAEEKVENVIEGTTKRTPDVPMDLPTVATGLPVATMTIKRKKGSTATKVTPSPEVSVSADKAFTPSQIFQFSADASQQDVLKIKEPGAGRWLALSAQFQIPDPENPEVKYPSVEHYMAGMKYKLATDKPELAKTIMSSAGKIHQKFLAMKSSTAPTTVSSDRDATAFKEEADEVKMESRPQAMAKYGVTYNEGNWLAAKDRVLEEALQYRWMHDKRFRKIIEAARDQGKYLLYYTGPISGSELGGKRRTTDGRIDGTNRVGKIMMTLANYPPF